MKQPVRAREKLGDVISTLLIIVGLVGLVVYMLYLKNLSNAVLRYAIISLAIVGISLAFILAILYLTRGVEHQGGLNNHERGLTVFKLSPTLVLK
jgi:uncharacterized membrane protein